MIRVNLQIPSFFYFLVFYLRYSWLETGELFATEQSISNVISLPRDERERFFPIAFLFWRTDSNDISF